MECEQKQVKKRKRSRTPGKRVGRRLKDFSVFCKKNNIGIPSSNQRETEHLLNCAACQGIWPLYFSLEMLGTDTVLPKDAEFISNSWSKMLEQERQLEYHSLLRREQELFEMLRCRTYLNGYQLFLRENNSFMKKAEETTARDNFKQKADKIGQMWQDLPAVQKNKYNAESMALKDKKNRLLKRLQDILYMKRRYKMYLKDHRNIKKPPKPENGYFLYKRDRWEKLKNNALKSGEKPPNYQEFLKLTGREWKESMTEDQKEKYDKKAKKISEDYFNQKELLKKQTRSSRKRKGEFGALRMDQAIHPGGNLFYEEDDYDEDEDVDESE